ncbi:hypothetical protein HRbin17_00630 [bacterium HR17]|uniref:Uncharacterized protein n=1 Tax=Candidatus Fervidibacter japonicus TaxID=2035412 RepID=A0A2H5XAB8_9BACT|nr:hypothetical protein HRbin17_00630 [bacterium HR17]
MGNWQPADLNQVRTISITVRPSKVEKDLLARPLRKGATFVEFWHSLPSILAAKELRELVDAVVRARRDGRPVIALFGAHVIKVGLSPIVIQLVREGILTALAVNGATAYHDVELALFGRTSEDVTAGMQAGVFGMAKEPCDFINAAAQRAAQRGIGLGQAIGEALLESNGPFVQHSVLAQSVALGVPVTVHVAFGTDVNHMHGSFDPASWGVATHHDFRLLCRLVRDLTDGVVLLWGSAVVLPTVLEKALTVARNLWGEPQRFVGATFDFIRHYRAWRNPPEKADALGGKGYYLTGHHELLIPLFAQAVLEQW